MVRVGKKGGTSWLFFFFALSQSLCSSLEVVKDDESSKKKDSIPTANTALFRASLSSTFAIHEDSEISTVFIDGSSLSGVEAEDVMSSSTFSSSSSSSSSSKLSLTNMESVLKKSSDSASVSREDINTNVRFGLISGDTFHGVASGLIGLDRPLFLNANGGVQYDENDSEKKKGNEQEINVETSDERLVNDDRRSSDQSPSPSASLDFDGNPYSALWKYNRASHADNHIFTISFSPVVDEENKSDNRNRRNGGGDDNADINNIKSIEINRSDQRKYAHESRKSRSRLSRRKNNNVQYQQTNRENEKEKDNDNDNSDGHTKSHTTNFQFDSKNRDDDDKYSIPRREVPHVGSIHIGGFDPGASSSFGVVHWEPLTRIDRDRGKWAVQVSQIAINGISRFNFNHTGVVYTPFNAPTARSAEKIVDGNHRKEEDSFPDIPRSRKLLFPKDGDHLTAAVLDTGANCVHFPFDDSGKPYSKSPRSLFEASAVWAWEISVTLASGAVISAPVDFFPCAKHDADSLVLGAPFLKHFAIVHDADGGWAGFAPTARGYTADKGVVRGSARRSSQLKSSIPSTSSSREENDKGHMFNSDLRRLGPPVEPSLPTEIHPLTTLCDNCGSLYHLQISMGTPPQALTVALDTGSSRFFVASESASISGSLATKLYLMAGIASSLLIAATALAVWGKAFGKDKKSEDFIPFERENLVTTERLPPMVTEVFNEPARAMVAGRTKRAPTFLPPAPKL